jgi:large subunit ribosomal protein L21
MAQLKKQPTGPFAVITTGGKQYVVREGDSVTIEKLPGEHKAGDAVTFSEVLLVDSGSDSKIGTPTVPGASVSATVTAVGKGKKIRVEKFKAKTGYHKVYGHRQPFVRVVIGAIK